MDNCKYKSILVDVGVAVNEYDQNNWKPLTRQCLVSSGVCCLYFMHGLFLGSITVLVAQIREDSSSKETVTDEILSWLATSPAFGSVPFIFLLPLLFNHLGRKVTFFIACLSEVIGFIILYKSVHLHHIIISGLFMGPTLASIFAILPVIIAEYTSPKYRGIFLTLKSATWFWGIWVANGIGTFFYWKNIPLVALVCSVYLLSVLMWPESPHWLASKGRFEEAAKSHRWLKGVNEHSEKELAQLFISIKNEKVKLSSTDEHSVCSFSNLSKLWSMVTSSPFYKPVIICIILTAQNYFTGKYVISIYAIQVLKRLSPDQSFVYKSMLILDGVTVFSLYVGCIVSRYCKRRTLLLWPSSIGIAILFILSLYLYLASLSVIIENDIVTVILLSIFSIAVGCGPIILSMSMTGEIIPPRYQNVAMMCIGSCGFTIIIFVLKFSPFMFSTFKMKGSFLFYAISSSILVLYLYRYLPETKNKSMQEIEQYFENKQAITKKNKDTDIKEVELKQLMNIPE